MDEVDVVVVGAGLAGLTAAHVVQRYRHSVAVLEARERAGGRLLSKPIGGATFDVGGQWIGPDHWRMHALVRDFDLQTFPTHTAGDSVLHAQGRRITYEGTIPTIAPWKLAMLQNAAWAIDRLARRSASLPRDSAMADRLDSMTLATWARRVIPSASARKIMDSGLKVVFGANPEEISLLWALHYIEQSGGVMPLLETRGGAQDTRFVAGAQAVPNTLASRLRQAPHYNQPVQTVKQDDHGVVVTTPDHSWRTQQVIIAVPPALTAEMRFLPDLPSARAQLVQRMPMGATIKALALYDSAFWRAAGLSGEAVMTDGPLSVIFDNSSHDDKVPALVGFCVGQNARDLAELAPDVRRARVLAAFSECFGPQANQAIGYEEQDWQAERWTRGCPTGNFGPGTMRHFAPALREPVGRIQWAGTETATQFCGFMEGAVQSGHRAGEDAVRELTKSR